MADDYSRSINTYTGNGATVLWPFSFAGGYISRDHVKVRVYSGAGEAVARSFDWVDANTIKIDPAVAAGTKFDVYRDTPKDSPLASFTDGAFLTEQNLDKNAKQSVFIAAEAQDFGAMKAGRGLVVPGNEAGYTLQPAATRAGKLFAWAVSGSPIAMALSDLADLLAPLLSFIRKGDKGDPGGNVMSVGLFTQVRTVSVPVGTDFIQTSGYSVPGIGAARYAVGAAGAAVPETRTESNSKNGRPVRLAEAHVTIDMLGAIPDCNTGTGAGTDCSPAVQYGVDWLGAQGGAELWIPGRGAYLLTQPIKPRNRVSLRGAAQGLQGGGGTLYVAAPQFLSFNDGGYPVFNIRGCAVQAGTRGVTDFVTRQNGVWSYSTVADNYFVNFRKFDHVGLGLHAFNNNFQNFKQIRIGGADHEFSFNYANYDVDGPTQLTKDEVFWIMEAVSATSFSFNYLTCLKNAAEDPIVFEWALSQIIQCAYNKFDGGTRCSWRIRSGSSQVKMTGNRATSIAKYSTEGYVPFILNQDIADVQVCDNFVQGIEQGLNPPAPFVSLNGRMYRVTIADNMVNRDKADAENHDVLQSVLTDGSKVTITGGSVPKKASLPHGKKFFSHHFTRLLTNDSAGGTDNPRINYIDMSALDVGMVIKCFRADTSRRWILYDEASGTSVYDSDRDTGRRGFNLVCTAPSTLALDI